MNIELHNGEALKVLAELARNNIKVDAVITDIPYGTTKRNGIGIEIDEEYFKIAQGRVLEAKGKVGLFA